MRSLRRPHSLVPALPMALAALALLAGCGGSDAEEQEAPAPPALDSGSVAAVAGLEAEQISLEQFDLIAEQAAVAGGFREVPAEGAEGYEQLNTYAMSNLLQTAWLEGEAVDQGISLSDEQVAEQLISIQEESFKDQAEFEKALLAGRFCTEDELADGPIGCEEARAQARFLLLSDELLDAPEASDEDIDAYYEENIEQFEHAALRDVRVILNEDQAKAEAALKALQTDDSEASWERVATQLSQDQASNGRGGLLSDVAEDRGNPDFLGPVFEATEGALVGPFETARGFFVIQVIGIEDAGTTELDEELREQLRPQVATQLSFDAQEELVAKWKARTVCAEDHVIELCSNFEAPDETEG